MIMVGQVQIESPFHFLTTNRTKRCSTAVFFSIIAWCVEKGSDKIINRIFMFVGVVISVIFLIHAYLNKKFDIKQLN